MNKIFLTGRLTKDVSLSETPSGVAVATFTLAVERPYADESGKSQSDFFPCVAFRRTAETLANYLRKGDKLLVFGYLTNRTHTAKNGEKRLVSEIIANSVGFSKSIKKCHKNKITANLSRIKTKRRNK